MLSTNEILFKNSLQVFHFSFSICCRCRCDVMGSVFAKNISFYFAPRPRWIIFHILQCATSTTYCGRPYFFSYSIVSIRCFRYDILDHTPMCMEYNYSLLRTMYVNLYCTYIDVWIYLFYKLCVALIHRTDKP